MREKSTAPLISYRRAGGMAGLNQRLTVFGDGRAELDDRRARSRSQTALSAEELGRLRSRLEAVPAQRWAGRAALLVHSLLPRPRDAMRIELRRGSRGIAIVPGHAEADVASLLAELDELLARAVRERRT